MAMVPIDQLSSGMMLAEDVRDINARLLLSKGLHIKAKHIRILKMWGIFQIHVAGTEPVPRQADGVDDAEHMERVKQVMLREFAALDLEHPAIRELLRLLIPYRTKKMQQCPSIDPPAAKPPAPEASPSKDILTGMEHLGIKLPEVPAIVFELNEIIADPLSSAADIARLVNQSPSLAALLLKLVNSAFYGFRSKIDSISRAVVLIGSKEVSSLALGITTMETFKNIPGKVMDVASFLEHNLACGTAARILAAHGNIMSTEQLFVSGMLHDIGRLVLCKYFPRAAASALANALHRDRPLLKTEGDMIGYTHAQIGSHLIKKWKLPYALENNIRYHHNPSASPNPESAAVVQMADIIVHGLGIGASGEHKVPGFDVKAWDRLGLSAGALPSVVHHIIQQMEKFRKIFTGE